MSTAIARIDTPEGFVIAADCRAFDYLKGVVSSDSVQKIFPVPNRRLAYTLAGPTIVTRGEPDEIVFDFVEEAKKALQRLPKNLNNVDEFAEAVGSVLYRSLALANNLDTSNWLEYLAEGKPTMISLDGYYDSEVAVQLELVFNYRPYAPYHIEQRGGWIGSRTVNKVLRDRRDPRLVSYRFEEPTNLSDAISAAQKYILAYSDPEAHKIDPDTCASVGKRIHMATITQANGFRWVPGFEPL
jgi:hypothetical protein